ncbi:hypothetical protein M409DRAFT_54752 [Zasmidium cellare ATCC 36951]|uniref:Uncharacterized protein n=1 Tax=Zasmidium cellare ATCC 36951 TaxID=1080233 RepID=A0A6A6CJM7_ZASCE|nr:uncharacterized protein M409DRAFT_54752 [Zasmidium cellare ATCC 36951]KAF2166398.1 hypothetical protein M409DRAFT_54752 [Zasmidium cellare ATCC 36951]
MHAATVGAGTGTGIRSPRCGCTAAPCLFLSALQPPHFEGLLLLTSAHQGSSLTWQSHTSLSSNITYNNVILTSRRLTEDDDALEPSGRMFGVLFLFQDDESTSQSRPAIGNNPHRTMSIIVDGIRGRWSLVGAGAMGTASVWYDAPPNSDHLSPGSNRQVSQRSHSCTCSPQHRKPIGNGHLPLLSTTLVEQRGSYLLA